MMDPLGVVADPDQRDFRELGESIPSHGQQVLHCEIDRLSVDRCSPGSQRKHADHTHPLPVPVGEDLWTHPENQTW
jgi:hypothetical protein